MAESAENTVADDTVVGDEAVIGTPVEETGQPEVPEEETVEKIAAAREEIHQVAESITTEGVPVARAEKAILLESVTKPTETLGDYGFQTQEELQHRFNHRVYSDYTPPPFPSPQV